jgi:uncharacterized protein YndB with AHSA1/START domain
MQAGELMLHLETVLPAPPARVFKALTDPDELPRWWGPRGFTTPGLELELREGGSYRIAMQPPEGDLFYLQGEYREVDPPRRLVYTFRWEDPDPDDVETVVNLSLRDLGESTEMSLDQGAFATQARHDLHEQGWTDSFERLRAVISSDPGQPARPGPDR